MELPFEVAGAVRVARQLQSHRGSSWRASSEAEPPLAPDGTTDVNGRPRRIVAGIRERHRAVHELLSRESPLHGISRYLQLAYYAVRRHARIPDVDDLLVKVTSRRTLLNDFKSYIYKRFAGGCHNASQQNLLRSPRPGI